MKRILFSLALLLAAPTFGTPAYNTYKGSVLNYVKNRSNANLEAVRKNYLRVTAVGSKDTLPGEKQRAAQDLVIWLQQGGRGGQQLGDIVAIVKESDDSRALKLEQAQSAKYENLFKLKNEELEHIRAIATQLDDEINKAKSAVAPVGQVVAEALAVAAEVQNLNPQTAQNAQNVANVVVKAQTDIFENVKKIEEAKEEAQELQQQIVDANAPAVQGAPPPPPPPPPLVVEQKTSAIKVKTKKAQDKIAQSEQVIAQKAEEIKHVEQQAKQEVAQAVEEIKEEIKTPLQLAETPAGQLKVPAHQLKEIFKKSVAHLAGARKSKDGEFRKLLEIQELIERLDKAIGAFNNIDEDQLARPMQEKYVQFNNDMALLKKIQDEVLPLNASYEALMQQIEASGKKTEITTKGKGWISSSDYTKLDNAYKNALNDLLAAPKIDQVASKVMQAKTNFGRLQDYVGQHLTMPSAINPEQVKKDVEPAPEVSNIPLPPPLPPVNQPATPLKPGKTTASAYSAMSTAELGALLLKQQKDLSKVDDESAAGQKIKTEIRAVLDAYQVKSDKDPNIVSSAEGALL